MLSSNGIDFLCTALKNMFLLFSILERQKMDILTTSLKSWRYWKCSKEFLRKISALKKVTTSVIKQLDQKNRFLSLNTTRKRFIFQKTLFVHLLYLKSGLKNRFCFAVITYIFLTDLQNIKLKLKLKLTNLFFCIKTYSTWERNLIYELEWPKYSSDVGGILIWIIFHGTLYVEFVSQIV